MLLLIFFSDFVIVKCNLLCRENAHFHCCYCPATVLRKVQLITHLQKCKKKLGIPGQEAQSPLLHSPAATAPLPTISAQTSHVITQVPPLSCPMSICTSSSPVTSVFQVLSTGVHTPVTTRRSIECHIN